MKRKKRYIARLSEVNINREGDTAVIQYKENGVPGTHLQIGSKIARMWDQEILDLHNECLLAQAQLASEYKNVVVEVPLNSPQIKYFASGDQWVPRGKVLRCVIEGGTEGGCDIGIDDHELSLKEFGRLLTTFAGWGMRIEFVPEDEIHRRPAIEIREPKPEEE